MKICKILVKKRGRRLIFNTEVFFMFLVCTFHLEPIVVTDLNHLYLKNYLGNFSSSYKCLTDPIKLCKIRSTCINQGGHPMPLNKICL